MKKLILHIGTEKTGTTSIQNFLYENRNELLEKNIYIPKNLGYKNHRKLATICMNDGHTDDHHKSLNLQNSNEIKSWQKKTRFQIENELKEITQETTIITSEHFSSRLTNKYEVIRLKELLANFFDDIKVVIYLRRQDEYAVSLYSTALKDGMTHRQILPNKKLTERYDYFRICTLWESVFNKIDVRIFEKNRLINNDLISDFLTTNNIPTNKLKRSNKKDNPSITAEAQEYLLAWNKINPKYNKNGVDPKHNDIVKTLEDNFPGKQRMPIKSHVTEWLKKYEESNKKVRERYFPNEKVLFSTDFTKYPEKYQSIDIGKAVLSISEFIENLKSK